MNHRNLFQITESKWLKFANQRRICFVHILHVTFIFCLHVVFCTVLSCLCAFLKLSEQFWCFISVALQQHKAGNLKMNDFVLILQ